MIGLLFDEHGNAVFNREGIALMVDSNGVGTCIFCKCKPALCNSIVGIKFSGVTVDCLFCDGGSGNFAEFAAKPGRDPNDILACMGYQCGCTWAGAAIGACGIQFYLGDDCDGAPCSGFPPCIYGEGGVVDNPDNPCIITLYDSILNRTARNAVGSPDTYRFRTWFDAVYVTPGALGIAVVHSAGTWLVFDATFDWDMTAPITVSNGATSSCTKTADDTESLCPDQNTLTPIPGSIVKAGNGTVELTPGNSTDFDCNDTSTCPEVTPCDDPPVPSFPTPTPTPPTWYPPGYPPWQPPWNPPITPTPTPTSTHYAVTKCKDGSDSGFSVTAAAATGVIGKVFLADGVCLKITSSAATVINDISPGPPIDDCPHCVYVKAILCAGQAGTLPTYNIYVRQSAAQEGDADGNNYFGFDGFCWQIADITTTYNPADVPDANPTREDPPDQPDCACCTNADYDDFSCTTRDDAGDDSTAHLHRTIRGNIAPLTGTCGLGSGINPGSQRMVNNDSDCFWDVYTPDLDANWDQQLDIASPDGLSRYHWTVFYAGNSVWKGEKGGSVPEGDYTILCGTDLYCLDNFGIRTLTITAATP